VDQQTTVLVNALNASIGRETSIFQKMGREMERLRESFQQKTWTAGLGIAQEMERFAPLIEEADEARDRAYVLLCGALGVVPETAFSSVLSRMSAEHRGALEESWRSLRMSIVHLSTATSRMRYSAEALASTLNRVLEEIFPHRRGRIYSRRGKATSVNDSLLVDRRL